VKRSQSSIMALFAVLVVCGVVVAATTSRRSRYYRRRPMAVRDSNDVGSGNSETGRIVRRENTPVRPVVRNVKSVGPKLAYLADANAVRSRVKAFGGLGDEVSKLAKGSQRAMHEWTRPPAEDNLVLAKSVNEQVMQELVLIHKVAKEEGAKKTVAAVEGLMLDRQQRYGKMIQKLEAQRRRIGRGGRSIRGSRSRNGRYGAQENYGGRRGRYDSRYGRRGGRYDNRQGYESGVSRGAYREDQYNEEQPRSAR